MQAGAGKGGSEGIGPSDARADAERRAAGPRPGDDGRVGVYLHVPFCERVCPYCDFAVVAARPLTREQEQAYVEALVAELDARTPVFAGRRLASVYLGGGTPSLLGADSVARLIDAVRHAFEPDVRPPEITLEVNPSTIERARLPAFRDAGVGRLSIGVQSFDDARLKALGRAHRAEEAWATLEASRAARFAAVSVDLIFAGLGQRMAGLDADLDAVLGFAPEHVSTYELTFEPSTPFGRALAAGKLESADEDEAVAMIERIESRLEAGGFERYEISSHARRAADDEHRARHNARYWQRLPVLALGMGAHSTDPPTDVDPHGTRRANPRSLVEYLESVRRDPAEVGVVERLPAATARGERVFLALRQREGLRSDAFAAEFGAPPRAFFGAEIESAIRRGWLEEVPVALTSGDPGRDVPPAQPPPSWLRLTPAGRLLADSVAEAFVAASEGAGVPGPSV